MRTKIGGFSKKIEKRNWDHLSYLQRMTIAITMLILIIYIWMVLFSVNGYFAMEFTIQVLRELTIAIISGIAGGILVGFLLLVRYYFTKQWDLHIVVPNYLLYQSILASLLVIVIKFLSLGIFQKTGIGIGFILGGLIAIVAYAGEIKIEHSKE